MAFRFIHTSDWHLGLELCGHSRLAEQKLFLQWLLQVCIEKNIDALLVAGDIYDTSNPSVAAQQLLVDFLAQFRVSLPQASIVLVGGNHDSAMRLEIPRPLAMGLGKIHLVGNLQANPEVDTADDVALLSKGLLCLNDANGNPAAWCLAVPFLRSQDLCVRLDATAQGSSAAYANAVQNLYSGMVQVARSRNSHIPVIAMGHLTLEASARAGSEQLLVGGIESLDLNSLHSQIDYLALGHIHKAQFLMGGKARYCGSPLAMHFNEIAYQHGVDLVSISLDGKAMVESILVPELVPLLLIPPEPATWDALEQAFAALDWKSYESLPVSLHPLVQLQIAANEPMGDLRIKVADMVRRIPVRMAGSPKLLVLRTESTSVESAQSIPLDDAQSPFALLHKVWQSRYGVSPIPPAVEQNFAQVVAEVRTGVQP